MRVRHKRLGYVITVMALHLVVTGRTAQAGTFLVDRTDDAPTATACTAAANDCSLRGAVIAADATPNEASTITVPAGTFLLTQATDCTFRKTDCGAVSCDVTVHFTSLCLIAPITLQGDSAATTIIDGTQAGNVALVSALVTVELRDLTLTHGRQQNSDYGGGGVGSYGTLTLTRTRLHANSAVLGGGVYSYGPLTVFQSLIDGNFTEGNGFGEGGGIFVNRGGSATVVESTIADNTADLHGGGLGINQGSAVVHDSTISGNHTIFGNGGGIQTFGIPAYPVTLVITNSTLSGNSSQTAGGGLNVNPNVDARLQSVTIAGNSAGTPQQGAMGGGIQVVINASVTIRNSLIAGNTGVGADCATDLNGGSSLTSEGYNLIANPTLCLITGDTTGNQLNVAPALGPLADNGGPTLTRALLPASPALDAGNPAGCTDDDEVVLAHDQRGLARAVDGDGNHVARCDIGAVEQSASGALAVTSVQPSHGGNAGTALVVVHGSGFDSGTTITLVRNGEADIVGTDTTVAEGGLVALTRFDLAGKTIGDWQLVVGTAATTPTFTIESAAAPALWVDVVGRIEIRKQRPARYLVQYGNRGNTDAFAVPLLFAFPETVDAVPQFDVEPPPRQFGKTTILAWGQFQSEVVAGDGPPLVNLILVVPVVPAGFSGALAVTVATDKIGTPFTLRAEIADPLADQDGPKPAAVAELVAGARARSAELFKYTLPSTIEQDLTDYMTTALQTVVDDGVQSLLVSGGTTQKLYSLTQLGYDLAAFGLVWAKLNPPPTVARGTLPSWPDGPAFLAWMTGTVAETCSVATADAQLSCVCGSGPCGVVCCPGCMCPRCGEEGPPPPPTSCLARLQDIGKGDCKKPETPGECRE